MVTITTTQKTLTEVDKKYCRVILTEDTTDYHRLVETASGALEYRLGAGKRSDMTARTYRTLVRSIVQAAKSHQIEHLAIHLGPMGCTELEALGEEWYFRTLAENLTLASYTFTTYKTKQKKDRVLKEIVVCGVVSKEAKRGFASGLTVATAANLARDIANTPGDDMTPSKLGQSAKQILGKLPVKVTVHDEAQIKKLKMNLLHAVGKGADDRPRFIVMEYWGAGAPTKTKKAKPQIILVGKGITYDTGGLNVKPAGGMHDMHMDMSGGAAVIGAIHAAASLGLKQNVIGLIPAAENSISATSMRAGDIVTSMNGKTVEILHTDAEGRMVLADALTYAQKYYQPKVMIDCATLTGASLVALGQHASAVLTKHSDLQDKLVALGEETGDLVWPLPLWDEYKQHLKGSRADINNVAAPTSRFGGCIEGGTFLSFFVDKNVPWAHIDIAPRMTSIPSDKLTKGATGEPVRLLVRYIERA